MAFSDHKVNDYSVVRGKRIPGLLAQLPDEDREALNALFADDSVPYARLVEIIHGEAKNYPHIDPGWFNLGMETIRRYAKKARAVEVDGL